MCVAGLDAEAVLGHHGFSAVDGDGDAGGAGFHGEVEGAFFEGEHAAGFGARAFNKRGDVDAFFEDAAGGGYALLRASGSAVAADGNELAELEAPAEDGNFHERLFDEGGGAARDVWKQGGRIEIGDVVGHEDAGLVGGDEVEALSDDADAAEFVADADDGEGGVVERVDVAGEEGPGNGDDGCGDGEDDDYGNED